MASQEKTIQTAVNASFQRPDSLSLIAQMIQETIQVGSLTRQLALTEWRAFHDDIQNTTHHLATQAIQHTADAVTQAIQAAGRVSRLLLDELEQTSDKASDVWQHVFDPLLQPGMFQPRDKKMGNRSATIIPITIQDN